MFGDKDMDTCNNVQGGEHCNHVHTGRFRPDIQCNRCSSFGHFADKCPMPQWQVGQINGTGKGRAQEAGNKGKFSKDRRNWTADRSAKGGKGEYHNKDHGADHRNRHGADNKNGQGAPNRADKGSWRSDKNRVANVEPEAGSAWEDMSGDAKSDASWWSEF